MHDLADSCQFLWIKHAVSILVKIQNDTGVEYFNETLEILKLRHTSVRTGANLLASFRENVRMSDGWQSFQNSGRQGRKSSRSHHLSRFNGPASLATPIKLSILQPQT